MTSAELDYDTDYWVGNLQVTGDLTVMGLVHELSDTDIVTYNDTGAAGTATITSAGTYYGITSLTTGAFTPAFGTQKFRVEGTISIHHNSATRQHATIQWAIMESDGTTLVTALNFTRHEQSAASEYHTHHFSGIWTTSDTNAKRFRPRFTVETTNGAVITAAFVSLIVTPLPY
jgi:hypothetical protein